MADSTTRTELVSGSPKVFISYSHQDSSAAERLRELLELRGFRIWLDQAEVLPGASIADSAWRGIDDADAVVFLLSPKSVHSPWVSMELAAALALQSEHPEKKIIPVVVGSDVRMPPLLYDTKAIAIDSPELLERSSAQIADAINRTGPSSSSASRAAANAYRMLEAQEEAFRAEKDAWLYADRATRLSLLVSALTAGACLMLAVLVAIPNLLSDSSTLHWISDLIGWLSVFGALQLGYRFHIRKSQALSERSDSEGQGDQ